VVAEAPLSQTLTHNPTEVTFMDPVVNLEAQRALVAEANAIRDRWPHDGNPPAGDVARLQDVALELVELVQALDEWRVQGGFDPYTTRPDSAELAATGLLVDTAFGLGGLSEAYCLSRATRDGEDVLSFCERTPDGLLPLAELSPPREGYTPRGQTQD
jgi:hypothetical protein